MKTKTKDKEEQKKSSMNEIFILFAAGLITFFLISLPMNNLQASIKLSLFYFILIYSPFLIIIQKIKEISILEIFLLANLTGLGYASIYVIFDVFFRIPLSNLVFLFAPASILVLSYILAFKKS